MSEVELLVLGGGEVELGSVVVFEECESAVVLDEDVGVFSVMWRVSVTSAVPGGGWGVEGSESESSSQATSSSGAVAAPVEIY